MSFGEKVRRAREKAGITQEDLAAVVGTTRTHVGNIETGRIRMPNADLAAKLAKALGTTVERLVEGAA